jgi:hypothetical protein
MFIANSRLRAHELDHQQLAEAAAAQSVSVMLSSGQLSEEQSIDVALDVAVDFRMILPRWPFGVDILIATPTGVVRLLRNTSTVGFVRWSVFTASATWERLREATRARPRAAALLFIVPVPSRYTPFWGARAYRRLLLEAGEVVGLLENASANSCRRIVDFADDDVSDVLLIDGSERFVACCMEIASESKP